MEEAIQSAMQALRMILAECLPVTLASLRAAVDLAQLVLQTGRVEDAEKIFSDVGLMAVSRLGADKDETIQMMVSIGVLFQDHDEWGFAKGWFEKALQASVKSSGLQTDQSRRLQVALEEGLYELEDEGPDTIYWATCYSSLCKLDSCRYRHLQR